MRSATLNITTNDCDEATYNFSIQGTGTDPEVHLLGNAVNIADGDTTPSAVDHTDFKSQFVCAGAVTRTFTIQNLFVDNFIYRVTCIFSTTNYTSVDRKGFYC